jgi:hypothetical protein
MSAILDQIKRNALPAAVLRTAAKGALPLPGGEMIEILVYLTHNPMFAQDAKMTLAGWDLQSAIEAVSHADAPPEVIGYYWAEQNRRPAMMPALIENPGVTDNMLAKLHARLFPACWPARAYAACLESLKLWRRIPVCCLLSCRLCMANPRSTRRNIPTGTKMPAPYSKARQRKAPSL